jgi:probable rRNA maturation factor
VNVFVANEQDLRVDETRLSTLARHVMGAEKIDDSIELSILFVGADHIKKLNSRFAGNDYATDVLAFPMMDEDDAEDEAMLGDVVICPEIADANAKRFGHDRDREVETLLVHGVLHLLGYDHQGPEDKERMDKRLKEILDSFEPEAV